MKLVVCSLIILSASISYAFGEFCDWKASDGKKVVDIIIGDKSRDSEDGITFLRQQLLVCCKLPNPDARAREENCNQAERNIRQYYSDLIPKNTVVAKKTMAQNLAATVCEAMKKTEGSRLSPITHMQMAKACAFTLDHCLIKDESLNEVRVKRPWYPGEECDPVFGFDDKSYKFKGTWCPQTIRQILYSVKRNDPNHCENFLSEYIEEYGKKNNQTNRPNRSNFAASDCYPYNYKNENTVPMTDRVLKGIGNFFKKDGGDTQGE